MAAIATPSFVRSRSRILVASADPAVRKRVLQDPLYADSDSEEAVGGAHALAKLVEFSCDSVLLDRNLPDLDAEEVAEQIRKQFPRVEVEILGARFVGSKEQDSETREKFKPIEVVEAENAAAPFVTAKVSEQSSRLPPKMHAVATTGEQFGALPGMIGSSAAMQQVRAGAHGRSSRHGRAGQWRNWHGQGTGCWRDPSPQQAVATPVRNRKLRGYPGVIAGG